MHLQDRKGICKIGNAYARSEMHLLFLREYSFRLNEVKNHNALRWKFLLPAHHKRDKGLVRGMLCRPILVFMRPRISVSRSVGPLVMLSSKKVKFGLLRILDYLDSAKYHQNAV